jgi:hypothetical protein
MLYFWVIREEAGRPIDAHRFFADTEDLASIGPSPESEDPFVARITARPADVSIQSMNVDEALTLLCGAAGLHYQIAVRATVPSLNVGAVGSLHFLRVWARKERAADFIPTGNDSRVMGSPVVHDLPRERPFSVDPSSATFSPAATARANAAQESTLTFDRRAVSAVRVFGGYDEIEVSLLLRPGWLPDNEYLDNVADVDEAYAYWRGQFDPEYTDHSKMARSVFHSAHPGHAPYSGHFRRWMFPDEISNDDAELLARTIGPYTVERYYTHQTVGGQPIGPLQWCSGVWGGGLLPSHVRHWVPRRRQILETIARRNPGSTDRGPVVRIHFGLGSVTEREGLTVNVAEVAYTLDDVAYTLSATTYECPPSATSYVYADGTQVVKSQETNWPSAPHYRLAVVQTDEDSITALSTYDRLAAPPSPHDPGWVEYTGQVQFDRDRIGIRFMDTNLFNPVGFRESDIDAYGTSTTGLAITAYLHGHFWVQLTCTIRGDARMRTDAEGAVNDVVNATGERRRWQVRDTGFDGFQSRSTSGASAGNSYLATLDHAATDEAQFRNRADWEALANYAIRRSKELGGVTVAGEFTAFFITHKYRPGDAISGCDGLGLAFDRYPQVERVTHTNGPGGQRTKMTLTDPRHSPDAGAVG